MSDSLTSCSWRRSIVSAEAAWRRGRAALDGPRGARRDQTYESGGREALLAAIILGPNPEGRYTLQKASLRLARRGATLSAETTRAIHSCTMGTTMDTQCLQRPRGAGNYPTSLFGGVAQLARARVS